MDCEEKLLIIQDVKNEIKNSDVLKNEVKKYHISIDLDKVIDLIPMYFADYEVSARTDHGVIYFNNKLLEKIDQISHYALHESIHYFQQCFGKKPTKGSNDGDYLDNKFEQEAFRAQTEYLSETRGDEVAENYINKVLDHHEVDSKKEREARKKKLLQLSGK